MIPVIVEKIILGVAIVVMFVCVIVSTYFNVRLTIYNNKVKTLATKVGVDV